MTRRRIHTEMKKVTTRKYRRISESVSSFSEPEEAIRACSSKDPQGGTGKREATPLESTASTDLSSPPRAFPKMKRIKPNANVRPTRIRLRESRWEPISAEEERRRLKSVKRSKSMKAKNEKKDRKKLRSRKELVDDFHKEKDHFRPLTYFIDNRKRLTEELLDSLNLETRYEIFPELEEMSAFEEQKLIYGFLKGMSRKRLLAIIKGKNLSESSSSGESDVIFDDGTDNGNLLDGMSSSAEVEEKLFNRAKYSLRKKGKINQEVRTNEKKLEEGEILTSGEEIDESADSLQCGEKEEDCKEEDLTQLSPTRNSNAGLGSVEELCEADSRGSLKLINQKQREESGELERQMDEQSPIKTEQTFIISLNLPAEDLKGFGRERSEQKNRFEQKVVCILPPSPQRGGGRETDHESDPGVGIENLETETIIIRRKIGPASPLKRVSEVAIYEEEKLESESANDNEDEGGQQDQSEDEREKSPVSSFSDEVANALEGEDLDLDEPDIELVE